MVFPRIIECDKQQGSIYKGPQANLTSTLGFIRAFLESNRLLKLKSSEKKAAFPVMKNIWPTFPRIIAHDICKAAIYQGPQGILTIIVQMIRSLLWDLSGR